MTEPLSILLYGREPLLLKTRQWLLEAAGYQVRMATDLSAIWHLHPEKPLDLLILCHSLSFEECGRSLAIASARWPKVRTLVLTAGTSECADHMLTEVLNAMEGPAKLIVTVERLIPQKSEALLRVPGSTV